MLAEMLPTNLPFDAAQDAFFQHRQFTARADEHEQSRAEAAQMLRLSAVLLEVFALAGCLIEDRRRAAPKEGGDALERVRAQCGIEPQRTIEEAVEFFGPPGNVSREPPFETLLRTIGAAIELCPVDDLQEAAAHLGMQDVGHRIRVAHNALKAFTLRNDPRYQRQLEVLGPKYMMGTLSIPEIAEILSVSTSDAVHLLEQLGYARPLDRLRLTPEERSRLLRRVKEDRFSREGALAYSEEDVARSVIASERLEGIDVRSWIGGSHQ